MQFFTRTRCDFPPTKHTQDSSAMSSPIKLDNTLGALFLGNIFAAVFYGITSVQTFSYYKHSGQDPRPMKILVQQSLILKLLYIDVLSQIFFLWILDSLHLAFITDTLYTYTVKDFIDLLAISVPTRSIVIHTVVGATSDISVRRSAHIATNLETFKPSTYFQLAESVYQHMRPHDRLHALLPLYRMFLRFPPCSIFLTHAINPAVHRDARQPNLHGLLLRHTEIISQLLPRDTELAQATARDGSSAPLMSIPLSVLPRARVAASADAVSGKSQPQYEDQVLHIQIQTTTDVKSDSATHIV
ncbi:hypothetical protein A0H81_03471 [Grifola frondosa]|uniref:Uncharacterized protein n=1 Tax=Grifola frondosa TaxID=5627 RepID=A0A1C7MI82_GRIFR|nr:hypothetical protein A0H81_03471 [Grifola frondosa]